MTTFNFLHAANPTMVQNLIGIFVLLLGIMTYVKQFKTKIYLPIVLAMITFILIKECEITYYKTYDNVFLINIVIFLGLLFTIYMLFLSAESTLTNIRFEISTLLLLSFFGILLVLENSAGIIIFVGLEIQAFTYYILMSMGDKNIFSAEDADKNLSSVEDTNKFHLLFLRRSVYGSYGYRRLEITVKSKEGVTPGYWFERSFADDDDGSDLYSKNIRNAVHWFSSYTLQKIFKHEYWNLILKVASSNDWFKTRALLKYPIKSLHVIDGLVGGFNYHLHKYFYYTVFDDMIDNFRFKRCGTLSYDISISESCLVPMDHSKVFWSFLPTVIDQNFYFRQFVALLKKNNIHDALFVLNCLTLRCGQMAIFYEKFRYVMWDVNYYKKNLKEDCMAYKHSKLIYFCIPILMLNSLMLLPPTDEVFLQDYAKFSELSDTSRTKLPAMYFIVIISHFMLLNWKQWPHSCFESAWLGCIQRNIQYYEITSKTYNTLLRFYSLPGINPQEFREFFDKYCIYDHAGNRINLNSVN